ncbi:hypothetical protein CYY_009957 [Polysphondylium violaceum]|uniref:Uncharacterized protein n=1 Tax=Polysphondylium violaceum TaxID=133409 RepID=A0A8J4PKT4_9MYCE|nr:hypothetical protein CYY_009957 [Polysphondylium violaceum]
MKRASVKENKETQQQQDNNDDDSSKDVNPEQEKKGIEDIVYNQHEKSMENDFKESLKQFTVSGSNEDTISSLLENDEYFFSRTVTKQEIDKQNQFLNRQGDYFTKCVVLEEENQELKNEIDSLKAQIAQQNKTIQELKLSLAKK